MEDCRPLSSSQLSSKPLSDARSFSHEAICKILEARGGIDPVGLDSQLPCYEIEHTEVNMDEATLIGEVDFVSSISSGT
ncbi:serine/threonine-protein kinase STY8-like [Prunus yedoensis var. nudiflora]|uniref:Serine/threonine-protein kinase STY8-like n=1 Tax=Prunus yedoensis var. nudiflora TaxID=2094558 RepID=A0A314ZK82_PRUYE|nr:serine/threonine-protein kinase STY8-like [Prunus yedoensis var. nudiflora]